MPGKNISVHGDMVSTSACEESEESSAFYKIKVSEPHYEAKMKGYLPEIKYLRFLSDYINNEV